MDVILDNPISNLWHGLVITQIAIYIYEIISHQCHKYNLDKYLY